MRALLLAAGTGTRLRPLTLRIPKCLVEISGHPLLERWLELLLEAGIDRVLVNTHWLAQQVDSYCRSSRFGGSVDLVHEVELLGTAGTILANEAYFAKEPFLVAHADNLTDFDVNGLRAAHDLRPDHCCMTMLAFETDAPKTCGILELDGSHVVQRFHEKVDDPPGSLANAAVYILEPEVIHYISRCGRNTVDFSTEVIPAFVGRILAVQTRGYHRDIGTPASLAAAVRDVAAGRMISKVNHHPARTGGL